MLRLAAGSRAAVAAALAVAGVLACGVEASGGAARAGAAGGPVSPPTPPAPPPAAPDAAPALEPIRGPFAGYPGTERLVVKDAARWREVWAALQGGLRDAPPPEVDFAREMVLVAALGSRPTGGFTVGFERPRLEGGVLVVDVVEGRPGPGCMVTQAFTQPVAVARLARHEGEVRFADVRRVNRC
jgi:hypothetical protein